MRRLIVLSLSLLIASLTLTALSVGLGSAQPMPERVQRWHFESCRLPCWNGITPAITPLDVASARMGSLVESLDQPTYYTEEIPGQERLVFWAKHNPQTGSDSVVSLDTTYGLVSAISIQTSFWDHGPDSLMPLLGEVIALLGPPTCVHANEQLTEFDLLYAAENSRSRTLIVADSLDLNAPIWFFLLDSRSSNTCETMSAAPWRGRYPPEQYRAK